LYGVRLYARHYPRPLRIGKRYHGQYKGHREKRDSRHRRKNLPAREQLHPGREHCQGPQLEAVNVAHGAGLVAYFHEPGQGDTRRENAPHLVRERSEQKKAEHVRDNEPSEPLPAVKVAAFGTYKEGGCPYPSRCYRQGPAKGAQLSAPGVILSRSIGPVVNRQE